MFPSSRRSWSGGEDRIAVLSRLPDLDVQVCLRYKKPLGGGGGVEDPTYQVGAHFIIIVPRKHRAGRESEWGTRMVARWASQVLQTHTSWEEKGSRSADGRADWGRHGGGRQSGGPPACQPLSVAPRSLGTSEGQHRSKPNTASLILVNRPERKLQPQDNKGRAKTYKPQIEILNHHIWPRYNEA